VARQESSPGPVPSSLVAMELLGLKSGSESACRLLVQPILAGDDRFEPVGSGQWRLSENAASYAQRVPSHLWTWTVWAADARSRAIAGVRLEEGAVVAAELVATGSTGSEAQRRLWTLGRDALWVTAGALRDLEA